MTPSVRPVVRSGERQHGLDALRAGALLLGIVLHSLLPFIPDLPWLVTDSRTSALAGIPVYVIHLFRMALFMMLAGYFGRLVLHRRGPGRYVRDRTLRILLPLIVFWPISVLPLGILALVGAERRGTPVPRPPNPPAAENPLLAIDPGQLWFLAVVMQCVLIVVSVRALAQLLLGAERCARITATGGRLLSAPGGLLLALLPFAAALVLQGTVLGSVIAPTSVLPEAAPLTAYLGAFVVGWALQARTDALPRIARGWPVYLGLAVVTSAIGLLVTTPDSRLPLVVLAGLTAIAAWSWVYALVGLCVRFLHAERPWVRYLADASYWMYLIHLPLLVGIELVLAPLGWSILVKLLCTWTAVGLILLASYHLLVRSTPLGRWLNGRRYPFRLRAAGSSRDANQDERSAASASGRCPL